ASKPRKKTLSKRATARPVARALSPFPGSPRLRRRQRRLLDQEFAQRPDARRLSFVGSAQKVIAERRSDAGREWRNEAAGGEFVGGDGERGQRHTLPLGGGAGSHRRSRHPLSLIRKVCYSYQFTESPTVQCLTGRARRGRIFLFGFRHNPLKSPNSDE